MSGDKACKPALTLETLNPRLVAAEYAVRGEIAIRASQIDRDLKEGSKKYPFSKIIATNVGNPQLLGQKAITFFRQVLCLVDNPDLLEHELVGKIFPEDVIARAREYLTEIPGGTGAYSHSQGAAICRHHVAQGIEERDDGLASNPDDIFLTDGASSAVHSCMEMMLRDENDAILTPIPQYPLYSATLKLYGGTLLPYYLQEDSDWSTTVDHLQSQVKKAQSEGKTVRGLVVVNPGNPTGQVLSLQNLQDLVRFCKDESLVLLADEVYQKNLYNPAKPFYSAKKVLHDMGPDFECVQLVSFNSISKGFFGECGRRGGYMELVQFPQDVKDQMYKLASISLCPNINGQICMALMMNPPKEGDPSYPLYAEQRDSILQSLKRRAKLVVDSLNDMEDVSCQPTDGALYVFPRFQFSDRWLKEAESKGKAPDSLYCRELLEQTGIVTVPGSGFGQEEGTFHLRTTILPPESDMKKFVKLLSDFHAKFLEQWKD